MEEKGKDSTQALMATSGAVRSRLPGKRGRAGEQAERTGANASFERGQEMPPCLVL